LNPRFAALATEPGFRAARYALALLLGAACGAVLAIHKQPERSIASAPAPTTIAVNGTDPAAQEVDALLYRTLREISDYRIDAALSEIDKVITSYPNFRLGQHIIHEGAA
jgi:hypothetical protein